MSDIKYQLSELQNEIGKILEIELEPAYRVIAEISSIKVHGRGHAYLDLTEKDETNDTIKAKARAVIWANTYRMIKPYFETVTGEALKEGMKIEVSVKVSYHPVYGLSLDIFDINPEFTLGDLERRRLEVIRRLEDDGVINMNKELMMPQVPQRLAVISSKTAAGLEDFLNQLLNNEYGYGFSISLFPALMQGNEAPASIVAALDKVFAVQQNFDAVVLVRGGGAKTDLACFDHYDTVVNIAQFPLPVITGIGHERDFSISDMVANVNLKTPTAAAEFLINKLLVFESEVLDLQEVITNMAREITELKKKEVELISERLKYTVKNQMQLKTTTFDNARLRLLSETNNFIKRNNNNLDYLKQKLRSSSYDKIIINSQQLDFIFSSLKKSTNVLLSSEQTKLDNALLRTKALDPMQILKMGYSYTKRGDTVITDASVLKKGDEIITTFRKGSKKSKIS